MLLNIVYKAQEKCLAHYPLFTFQYSVNESTVDPFLEFEMAAAVLALQA